MSEQERDNQAHGPEEGNSEAAPAAAPEDIGIDEGDSSVSGETNMSAAKKQSKAIGLDIGTSRIVMATENGEGFQYESQLNAFVNIPFSQMTLRTLQKDKVPFTRRDGELLVHGNESEKFADVLGRETRRPMIGGILNPTETVSTDVIRNLLLSLLGEKNGDGAAVYFSVPAAPLGEVNNLTWHEAAIRDMLTEKGYNVHSLNEGLAVIFGELQESNYTGIGISFGGGLCNVCLAYLSVPVFSFSVAKAGDFIDNNAAAVAGDKATRIRLEKETAFHFNGRFSNNVHQAIGVYYDDMIRSVIDGLREMFNRAPSLPRFAKPVPLVLSGGTAMPKGFAGRFEEALKAEEFPIPLAGVRLAEDLLVSTAKGALVAALAEN